MLKIISEKNTMVHHYKTFLSQLHVATRSDHIARLSVLVSHRHAQAWEPIEN